MAPKRPKREADNRHGSGEDGMFSGMVVFLVDSGVQSRRLQVWKQKLLQMGAKIEGNFSRRLTHVFANDLSAFMQQVGQSNVAGFKGKTLAYRWLEDSLRQGEKMNEETYNLVRLENMNAQVHSQTPTYLAKKDYGGTKLPDAGKSKSFDEPNTPDTMENAKKELTVGSPQRIACSSPSLDADRDVEMNHKDSSSLYTAPDLNKNITEIFGKLVNIYGALGDDRRSFSYHKAVSVIEKLPFKIDSVDQVKDLPSIGKSLQDHIHEIITTGKLSKLEHFESDEKVRTVTLFGEVWGIGPVTALKLYEKGYRSLPDLEKEDSLTNSQKLGVKYFDDIRARIPREEVKHMESILQKAGELILPGVIVICGGSYRRGKATCGDLDIVITHPDGESHKGFLTRYVKHLKDIDFLKEDLIFSVHSVEGTDSGVDTYFGLCTYPGREQRHRIDLKVYPRDIFAFGLIAWTGNDVLNRRLRLLADSKGYKLDDTGLYLATQSSGGEKGTKSSTSLKFKTEKEVFDYLDFPWLEPHQRNL